jgi:hypothetical protein
LSKDASGHYRESFRTAKIDMPNLWVEVESGASPSELVLRFARGELAQPEMLEWTLWKADEAWAVAKASRSVLARCSDGSIGSGLEYVVDFTTGWVTVVRYTDCERPRTLRRRSKPLPRARHGPLERKVRPRLGSEGTPMTLGSTRNHASDHPPPSLDGADVAPSGDNLRLSRLQVTTSHP